MNPPLKIAPSVATAVLIVLVVWLGSIGQSGAHELGPIESVAGIPFPAEHGRLTITENLAHADVKLREPVFGKTLRLTFEFTPHATRQLAVGVRQDSFWLSYDPIVFYQADDASVPVDQARVISVTLPLTEALQDVDRSIDVIWFAEHAGLPLVTHVTDPRSHETNWQLADVRTETIRAMPSASAMKDYIRSVLTRERPL